MEFPQWFEDQKINCVHVSDVAKAIFHLAVNGKPNSVYNLCGKDNLGNQSYLLFSNSFRHQKVE